MAVNLSELLQWPLKERLEPVESIWDSIAEFPEAIELTEAQKQELDRRLESYKEDSNAGVPWPELRSRLLAD